MNHTVATMSTGGRCSGRTKAMVQELPGPPATPVVVVPTWPMRRYLERMLRDLRPDVRANILVIANTGDADRLRGRRGLFYVDHAFWSLADRQTAAIVEIELARASR